MFGPREHETPFLHALRLIARAASIVCIAVILLFLFGEGFNFGSVTAKQWAGFFFFPVMVFVGLVLAWREEAVGGLVSIAGVAGIYIVYGLLLNGSIRQGWAFLPFLVPGILFVLYKTLSTSGVNHRRVSSGQTLPG